MFDPIFARTDEGVEITTPWPLTIPATRAFIEMAEPQWLQRKWRTLFFTLTNGSAVYRIASRDHSANYYVLERIG